MRSSAASIKWTCAGRVISSCAQKILGLAKQGGLDVAWPENLISRIAKQAGQSRQLIEVGNIYKATIKFVESAIEPNRKLLV